MEQRRIGVTDRRVLEEVGSHVVVGKTFMFVRPEAFSGPHTRWVARMLGWGRMARVVSLMDRERAALFGVEIESALPAMFLGSVTSDRGVYRADRDIVRLLVARPFHPGGDETLEVRVNGQVHATPTVRLDRHGVAPLELRDLPTGDYEVRLKSAPESVAPCTFTVAEYRLAPLVASIVERRLDGTQLSLALRLDTLGVPVEGGVHVELMDRDRRAWRGTETAHQGQLAVTLRLDGQGPFTVNLQLVEHPGRTATVALVGSRAEERSLTLFSPLGTEVQGSLLPFEEARPVRGVWLGEGATRTSPFRLERVDARRARLVSRTRVQSGRVVVIDASWPRRRPDAVDPSQPDVHRNPLYQAGDASFKQGEFAMALTAFREGRSRERSPHPYFAYFEACCLARLGRGEEAIGALRQAIADGWTDFDHLASDEDLAALRDMPAFAWLQDRGLREVAFETLAPDQVVEVEVPSPAAAVAIGAYVDGQPWEGWAVTVAPPPFSPEVEVPPVVKPDSDLEIRVRSGGEGSPAVYLVVKDGRLPSPDTPENRLAGGIKALAEEAAACLGLGQPKALLSDLAPPPPPPMPPPVLPSALPRGPMRSRGAGVVYSMADSLGASLRSEVQFMGAASEAPPPVPRRAPAPAAPLSRRSFEEVEGAPPAPPPGGATLQKPTPSVADEPEVIFAGLLEMPAGEARKTVRLGPAFATYVVEAFVVDGPEWAACEARFEASRQPFVTLETPVFVHPSDSVAGRLIAGCGSGRMQVVVTRDGQEVLLDGPDGRALLDAEGAIEAPRVECSFVAPPGEYRAVVRDLVTGEAFEARRRVEVPGRLRRRARAIRVLQAGEEICRGDDPSIRFLRLLPGLDKPFEALVEATADYGHACCEQTAAKMLAACAMYALQGGNGKRASAESIILAGVTREESMWLRGRGFKMYPESPAEPNDYWGSRAARYLWNLELLRDGARPGPSLSAGIDRCVEMAQDTCRAYGIEWPPRSASNAEEAWNVLRFGKDDGPRRAALDVLRAVSPEAGTTVAGFHGYPLGVVGHRADCAFAAAGLLRSGTTADRALATRLANRVTADLGPEGRLYSTVDSVAAIAMLAELRRGAVTGGRAEVNGRELSSEAAMAFTGEIESVRALEGTLSVEVEREVEEDWDAFAAGLDLRVALEQDGRVRKSFRPGDALDLSLTIGEGYKPGDLAWICLPEALSRLVGGAQVKRFAVDFADRAQIRVPLVATASTPARDGGRGVHHFAVCVRNMFEEERAANPGALEVSVE